MRKQLANKPGIIGGGKGLTQNPHKITAYETTYLIFYTLSSIQSSINMAITRIKPAGVFKPELHLLNCYRGRREDLY